jgi:integrase
MIIVNFYLRYPYKKSSDSAINQDIINKVKECKKLRKPVPKHLFYEKQSGILLAITIRKKMAGGNKAIVLKFSTDYKAYSRQWDFEKCLPAANNEIRMSLEEMRLRVLKDYNELVRELVARNEDLSLDTLKKRVESMIHLDAKLINRNNIYDAMSDCMRLNPGIKTERTRQKYETLKKHLKAFENATGYVVSFESMNAEFMRKWEDYMLTEYVNPSNKKVGILNTSFDKYKTSLKSFLRWANLADYHKNLFYQKITSEVSKTEIISLSFEEFQQIINYTPKKEHLIETRDTFIVELMTAQRYSDISAVQWTDIDLNKRVWNLFQYKGRKALKTEIPLHPYLIQILNKYKDQKQPLPIISNQKYNDNIKELCKLAGINEIVTRVRYSGDKAVKEVEPKWKYIGSHTARKSFLNIAPALGIPMEVAMSISGHSNYKVVQEHYRKVSLKEKHEAIDKIIINIK